LSRESILDKRIDRDTGTKKQTIINLGVADYSIQKIMTIIST